MKDKDATLETELVFMISVNFILELGFLYIIFTCSYCIAPQKCCRVSYV